MPEAERHASLEAGSLFRGRYLLETRLGTGGMSVVWRVHDQQTHERRALKINRRPDDAQWKARFLAECRLSGVLGRRDSRGFVRALDYDVDDPTWMVMDLVEEARPLGDRFRLDPDHPDVSGLIAVLTQVERAVELVGRMHELGIVHRDLKPDNLLVDAQGEVYVSDFGLAKDRSSEPARSMVQTHPGAIMGSPAYMPIEQFGGAEAVGPEADIYALGAVLFELIAAEPPFGSDDLPSIVARHKAGPAPALSERVAPWLPALDPLEPLCRAALSPVPGQRPSIAALREALSETLAALRSDAPDAPAPPELPPPTPRTRAESTMADGIGPAILRAPISRGSPSSAAPTGPRISAPRRRHLALWGTLGAAAAAVALSGASVAAIGAVLSIFAFGHRAPDPRPPRTDLQSCPLEGQVRTEDSQMQCCWPGQGWVASRGACVGTPQCPRGTTAFGDTCVAEPPPTPAAGAAWRSPSGVELQWVPDGTFAMGSPPDEPGRDADEGPVHEVTVGGLWVMRTEVTQGLWVSVMGSNPAAAHQAHRDDEDLEPCGEYQGVSTLGDDLPVICVDWFDAVRFANALSEREGLRPPYRFVDQRVSWDRAANGYRLLTEPEWEYAARGGVAGLRFAGASREEDACEVANVADATAVAAFPDRTPFPCDDGYPALAPVGRFRANAWGLHDMTGNVWEWVFDRYAPYPGAPERGDLQGTERVFRGGSWFNAPLYARVANRGWYAPDYRLRRLGLRLARPSSQDLAGG